MEGRVGGRLAGAIVTVWLLGWVEGGGSVV